MEVDLVQMLRWTGVVRYMTILERIAVENDDAVKEEDASHGNSVAPFKLFEKRWGEGG